MKRLVALMVVCLAMAFGFASSGLAAQAEMSRGGSVKKEKTTLKTTAPGKTTAPIRLHKTPKTTKTTKTTGQARGVKN